MTPRTARLALLAALILGVLADYFLRADSLRAGFTVWLLLALAVASFVTGQDDAGDVAAVGERRLLFGASGVIALLLVFRDAETLFAVDLFALAVTFWLIAWRAHGRALAALEPRDAIIGVASAVGAAVGGGPTLALRDASPRPLEESERRSMRGFGVGVIAAIPVLLFVTALLGSADPVFAGFVDATAEFLDTAFFGHVFLIGAATWVSAGALRGAVAPVGVGAALLRRQVQLPFAGFLPLLGGLALLLSAWIGLQVRTLFGGAEYVAQTAGITVAEYARNGFFELIVISGLVLAALLVADDVVDRADASGRSSFRRLGTVLIVLVGAVLTSAVLRLSLYLRYYGLTDERVLALAVLIWVAAVLGWFAWTVLRDAREGFAPGVLVISAAWLVALNVANPERLVVSTNLARAERGLEFDVAYHAKLSADALPALLDGADRLPADQALVLREALDAKWRARVESGVDWREWSLPLRRALRLMQQ
ncbi:MAG: DUF4173 domain-containing protein [Gemmatimonadaceae bacterium]|nr:DUF4173 domain-containing protein [Gemmatimonadaceae bacterium]